MVLCTIVRLLGAVFGMGLACQAYAIVIIYCNFNPYLSIYGEKRVFFKCESQLAKHVDTVLIKKKRPVETETYFELNKFKRNTEIYLILIVRNCLIENLEFR